MWGGAGLKNNFVDFSVLKKSFLTCLILSGKSLYGILKFSSTIFSLKNIYPLVSLCFSEWVLFR